MITDAKSFGEALRKRRKELGYDKETSLGNAKTFCHEALPYFA